MSWSTSEKDGLKRARVFAGGVTLFIAINGDELYNSYTTQHIIHHSYMVIVNPPMVDNPDNYIDKPNMVITPLVNIPTRSNYPPWGDPPMVDNPIHKW
jgi:hypothetical protein